MSGPSGARPVSAPRTEAEAIEIGIGNALAAQDVEAAVDMLRVLAGIDPHRAARVLRTIEVGIDIARERSEAPGER